MTNKYIASPADASRGQKQVNFKAQDRREIRRAHAEERQAYCDGLTPAKRLAALDKRPGEAKRERARLAPAE